MRGGAFEVWCKGYEYSLALQLAVDNAPQPTPHSDYVPSYAFSNIRMRGGFGVLRKGKRSSSRRIKLWARRPRRTDIFPGSLHHNTKAPPRKRISLNAVKGGVLQMRVEFR